MLSQEYWKEVKATTSSVVALAAEALECDGVDIDRDNLLDVIINDHILHEQIDGHSWLIYNYYHIYIMTHTDNEDYLLENIGEISGDDFSSVLANFAYWAFYGDVSECLYDAMNEYLEGLESKE